MDDPLRDAWVKHARALDHIHALNAACGELAWGEPKPYRIDVAFEPDAECHVARFVQLGSPDGRLGAMVGDVTHNLRVALDAAAWQLAIRHDRKAAKASRRLVAFPLSRGEKAFRRHDALAFFDERSRLLVESLQPYHQPNRRHLEALRLLATLSNADQHRVAAQSFASLDFSSVTYHPDGGRVLSVEDFTRPGKVLVGGAPVAAVTVDAGAQARVWAEGEPTLQVAFSISKTHFGPAAMVAMQATVEQVLIRLGVALR